MSAGRHARASLRGGAHQDPVWTLPALPAPICVCLTADKLTPAGAPAHKKSSNDS